MAIAAALEMTNPTDKPEIEEGSPPDHIKPVLLSILLLAGLVVLLIFGYITVVHRRGGMMSCGGRGLPGDLMVDAHPADPAETCSQTGARNSLGYRSWFNVLSSVTACHWDRYLHT